MATHADLGSRTMIGLSLAGRGVHTGEFDFGGDYVPIAIFTDNVAIRIDMIKRHGRTPVRDTPMSEFRSPDLRMVYHPDFFLPPALGDAKPRLKPGLIPARAPVVTIEKKDLAPNTPAGFRFSRAKSDTQGDPIAQFTTRAPSFTIKIESTQFNVTSVALPRI